MADKIKILYVDDEENNLASFRAFFRKEYEVYTAIGASEALRIIDSITVNIIISDQKMPNTSGIEFLERTIEKFPDCIRLLITGQSDIDIVIQAINRGQVTKYIPKPWDWDKLALAIENCADLYNSRMEIKEKNFLLQKTNDELNRFIYSISHDLRSPLMSILGVVQLAKMNDSTKEDCVQYLHLIETSVVKLDDYIKSSIEYYKNIRAEETLENIDFNWLIKDIIDSQKHQDQTIEFQTEIENEAAFIGDAFRIRIVISNLISNAIKYQNPAVEYHYVKIKIIVTNKSAQITISDNGVGILQRHIENIFKLFFRTQNTKHKEGTGIGLYIVKEALSKLSGTINVHSTPNVGTSFEISIPNKIEK